MESQEGDANGGDGATDHALDPDRIVKHIMVIGFHHKHGYQVDYCFPPITPEEPIISTPIKQIRLPDCWKTLPILCLPDGSHNYDNDTIYFTMPDNTKRDNLLTDSQTTSEQQQSDTSTQEISIQSDQLGLRTIFGTACFRQIQSDKLINRTDDITRVAVQKSVCVLSTKPLFGLIRSKLEMITHAYFEELDFSKVKILKLTYDNLNSLLSRDSVKENATFLGLSARQLVSQFGCNVLVLFKAMLLEKKILFYRSPVRDLCTSIMSMCSLFTGLLESGGLDHSTCDLQLDPHLLEALKLIPRPVEIVEGVEAAKFHQETEDKVYFSTSREEIKIISPNNKYPTKKLSDNINVGQQLDTSVKSTLSNSSPMELTTGGGGDTSDQDFSRHVSSEYEVITNPESCIEEKSDDDDGETKVSNDGTLVDDPYAHKLCRQKLEECGLPLQIFTRGSFCLPYLSISYLDVLADNRVRSYVIGATNFLFKQRRDIYDIIVDMEDGQAVNITINDPHLRKCLTLTTEDLRFMDYLTKNVKFDPTQEPRDEFDLISHETTKWIGGDEWIRYHFRLYTLYLLKAASSTPSTTTDRLHQQTSQESQQTQLIDSFNSSFVQSWKQTANNYAVWERQNKAYILNNLQARHPFSSPVGSKGLNLNDVKLKLSYAVNSSEKGRMISQTLHGIGKWSIWNNIATTSSSILSSVQAAHSLNSRTSPSPQSQKRVEDSTGNTSDPISKDQESSPTELSDQVTD